MKIALSFLLAILSSVFASQVQILQDKTWKNYRAMVEWDESQTRQRFIVLKHGKLVFEKASTGTHYWIGNHFDESLKGFDPYSGKDITGKNIPNLIMTEWSGGAHCCNSLNIFELGENEFKEILAVDGGSYGFKIKDLDGDNIPEIDFWDWPIDYWFNSFAHSAQGRVVLKFIDGKYRVANNLMYKKRPNDQVLIELKIKIRKDFTEEHPEHVPNSLLEIMMSLSYSGYKQLALQIASDTWPEERKDLKKFKSEFLDALSQSIYWKEFNARK